MDESDREKIRQMAEENGLDADMLLSALAMGNMPDDLRDAVGGVLGDVDIFERAAKQKDD